PDLHRAGPFRVEVNELSVGRVIRAVVQTGRCGELLFVATLDRDGVDVELAIAFAAKGERLAVRRPAMPVGRAGTGDAARRPALDGQDVNERFALLRLVADGQLHAVGREAVVIVAARGESGVKQLRFAAGDRQFADAAGAVEQEVIPVARPVGRFDVIARVIDDAPVFGGDGDGFQCGFERRLTARLRFWSRDFDVGEDGFLQRVVVVGANS